MSGKVKFDGLKYFQKQVQKLTFSAYEELLPEVAKTLGEFCLAKSIERTPVGDYSNLVPPYNKRIGGTLKGSWEVTDPVRTRGGVEITVQNKIPYASFVNDGHSQQVGRYVPALGKRLVRPYVKGQYFAEKAILDTKANEQRLLQPLVDAKLKEVLDGK